MPTSDVQRMHQDEWLADLLSTEDAQGRGGNSIYEPPYCVLGRAGHVANLDMPWTIKAYSLIGNWLGVSGSLVCTLFGLNDEERLTFAELAAWFKAERDAHDGDLSDWRA